LEGREKSGAGEPIDGNPSFDEVYNVVDSNKGLARFSWG